MGEARPYRVCASACAGPGGHPSVAVVQRGAVARQQTSVVAAVPLEAGEAPPLEAGEAPLLEAGEALPLAKEVVLPAQLAVVAQRWGPCSALLVAVMTCDSVPEDHRRALRHTHVDVRTASSRHLSGNPQSTRARGPFARIAPKARRGTGTIGSSYWYRTSTGSPRPLGRMISGHLTVPSGALVKLLRPCFVLVRPHVCVWRVGCNVRHNRQ